MFFCFLIKSYNFWLINYLFGLISINYLIGFNIKENGIRYYNFDIVPYFELSILLLLRESHIATQISNLVCLPHIMIFVYIFAVYISFECVCVYITVRTSFGLDSKTGLDLSPTSSKNKFVECGRKS